MGGFNPIKKIIAGFIAITCIVSVTEGKVLYVGGNRVFKTIKAAIDAALPNDSIIVSAGLYREGNIVITKPIQLIGHGLPILDGEYKYEILSVKSNDVSIEGFKIIRSGISSMEDYGGIKVYNSRNIIIRNNRLEETFFGIYLQYVSNCIIENNILQSSKKEEQQSGNGIHCWKSDSLQISGNTVSGHRDGIYFEFVTNSVITRNISKQNIRYGLHFMFSNSDKYTDNRFENNGAGVAVMFSKNVIMTNNFFVKNWGDAAYGLLLKEISDGKIERNKFLLNTIGIYMEGVNRVDMQHNIFSGNGWACKIQASCSEVFVKGNNFQGNTFDVGTNGKLVLSIFRNNYWDKYEGYDLNKDKIGDIPYRPVSLYAMIAEKNPSVMILFRSFIASLFDKTEKLIPSLTPLDLKDDYPVMKPLVL